MAKSFGGVRRAITLRLTPPQRSENRTGISGASVPVDAACAAFLRRQRAEFYGLHAAKGGGNRIEENSDHSRRSLAHRHGAVTASEMACVDETSVEEGIDNRNALLFAVFVLAVTLTLPNV